VTRYRSQRLILIIHLKNIAPSSSVSHIVADCPVVSHTERGNRIRLMSARELTRKERKAYEEEDFI
jgi:uncharacterized DUF497 family protein